MPAIGYPSHRLHRLDLTTGTTTSNLNNSLFQVLEDPLQSQRLKYAFESEKGLLGASDNKEEAVLFNCKYASEIHLVCFLALMHQSNNVDSRRCYQCVKFLVTLAQK